MELLIFLIIALIATSRVAGVELLASENLSSNELPNLMGINCGGLLEGLEGSYSYQAEEFAGKMTCVWVVKSTNGKSIRFTVDTLQSGAFFRVLSVVIYNEGLPLVSTNTLKEGGMKFSGNAMVLVSDSNANFSISWTENSSNDDEEELGSVAYVASNHGSLSAKASQTPSNILWVIHAPTLSAQQMQINMKKCFGQQCYVKLNDHYARSQNATFKGRAATVEEEFSAMPFTYPNTAIVIVSGYIKGNAASSVCKYGVVWGPKRYADPSANTTPQTHDFDASLDQENITPMLPSILLATDPNGAKIYYENNQTVTTVSNATKTTGVAFDFKSKYIYWSTIISNNFQLCRARTDGSDQGIVLTGLGKVYGMAFDWIGSNLYFAEFVNNQIGLCHVQLGCRTVLNDTKFVNKPTGLAIDPIQGYIYWTNRASGMESIARAGMNSSEPVILHDSDLGYPGGITVDLDNGQIYWIGEKKKVIETCNADGSNRHVLLTLDSNLTPFGIDNFDGKIYWGEFFTRKIYQFEVNSGRNSSDLVLETEGFVRHIAVYHEDKQPSQEEQPMTA